MRTCQEYGPKRISEEKKVLKAMFTLSDRIP